MMKLLLKEELALLYKDSNIGIDLVYMPRFVDKIDDDKFINKILTTNEIKLYKELNHPRRRLEFLCGRFAGKEAYSKAVGLGIGKIAFLDIEILKDENNRPYLNIENAKISISHDEDYVIAIVMIGDCDVK